MVGLDNSAVGILIVNRDPIIQALESRHCLLNKNNGSFEKLTQKGQLSTQLRSEAWGPSKNFHRKGVNIS